MLPRKGVISKLPGRGLVQSFARVSQFPVLRVNRMGHRRIKPKSGGRSLRKDWRMFWPALLMCAIPLLIFAIVIWKTAPESAAFV